MARVDLNIVDRGVNGTSWVAEEHSLSAQDLDGVMEMKTDNSGALNSLPTPFARFFVAREAFRRVHEEHLNPQKEAGYAYRQIVSDILDVYELLFNRKYHENNSWKSGQKLEIREWDCAENLPHIKAKMPILYNAIKDYFKDDIREAKLYFVIFTEEGQERLLACTSPITGFVTPPDMDKSIRMIKGSLDIRFEDDFYSNLRIRRKSGGEYFRDQRLFGERDADFKNYMYSTLFGSDNVDARYKAIKEYILGFGTDAAIRNDYRLKLTPTKTDQNDNLVVNGISFQQSDEIDINSFFTDTMIRLPYRISRENFRSVIYQNDPPGRDYDYLLPFKPEVVTLFDGQEIASDVHISRNSVKVFLRYNGTEYQKEYTQDPIRDGQGRIVDLQGAKINFDLGIFPNILSDKESENNYFKVLVVAADEDPESPNFSIDNISLSFFKKSGSEFRSINEVKPEDNAQFGVQPAVVRSRQKSNEVDGGTKFYELFNTSFDLIEVKVMSDTGLLIPLLKKSTTSDDNFTYAIDLGTSNTFMSRCKNGNDGRPDLSLKPELFKMERPMVNFLHETSKDEQYSLPRRIEDSVFEHARKKVKTEFLPAFIDGTDYRFPIRTAVCGIRDKSNRPRLFDNHNIAFFYEKLMAGDDQNVHTDIKWEQDEDLLRIFVRELLLIIKCDILQHNGDLDRTRLVWFSPLSFMGQMRDVYQDIWTSEPKNILFIQPDQIQRFSESEAPYYYYKKKDYIGNSDAVTVIDIGGGSTDFVYFKNNQPQVASSIHFGCDVLWENGFIEFGNERSNGIYNRYASNLRFQRKDLEELNVSFNSVDSAKTKDIINFWLSNAEYCDILSLMRRDFKPVFVYHLTSILYYMACMYKECGFAAPRSVVFSGNGSKYIDNFITSEDAVLKDIINMVFSRVFGGEHHVNLKLPEERKESTCYGGLYREPTAPEVKEVVYQGDNSVNYETVGDIVKNLNTLKTQLLHKYQELAALYKDVLALLKKQQIIDNTADTSKYINQAASNMGTPFSNYFRTQVQEKYQNEVLFKDSVFFLPVINKIFEMTKL